MKARFVRRSAGVAALLAALAAGLVGNALAVGSVADIQVFDRAANRRLPVYWHDGKAYVVGSPGNEYQISVANRTGGDILAVVSVDGVNAVSGETASPDQTGYVLGSWRSYDILGWRKSQTRTAAFYFTQLPDSYAARTGRPDNVGVIGVALFRRKPEPVPPVTLAEPRRDYRDHESYRERFAPQSSAQPSAETGDSAQPGAPAAPAPLASMAGRAAADAAPPAAPSAMEKSLGTGHGRNETSVVRTVAFERATPGPEEVITIYYDSLRNLVAMGIVPPASNPVPQPQPFPGRFVPDPPRG